MMPGWVSIRVPVPEEFVDEIERAGARDLALGARVPMAIGNHRMGLWTVESVEYTMSPDAGGVVVYWVTFGREQVPSGPEVR
jgi:hypothetical protein